MKDLIASLICWDKLGNHRKEQYIYEIKSAKISKITRELNLQIELNFIVPYDDIEQIRIRLMEELPQISGVSFAFLYHGVILDENEIIGLYMEHMINASGISGAHLTKTIFPDRYVYDKENGSLRIKALGAMAVEGLNREIGRQFSALLKRNFGISVDISFENDSDIYSDKARATEETAAAEARAVAAASNGNGNGNGNGAGKQSGIPAANSKGSRAPFKSSDKGTDKNAANRIMGKKIQDGTISIRELSHSSGTVAVSGKIFEKSAKITKTGRILAMILITDGTGSICAKLFSTPEKWEAVDEALAVGDSIKLKGDVGYDNFENGLVIMAKDIEKIDTKERNDDSEIKRVELHAHSKMSAMDGFIDAGEMVRTAARWGHKAVAITDHGVAQAFPEAMEAAKKLKGKIKVIYGMEGYVFNDDNGQSKYPDELSTDSEFVVFDLETTGLSALSDEIIEIGAVKVRGKNIGDTFHSFICPESGFIPEKITELTGITYEMVENAPGAEQIFNEFMDFCEGSTLVAHNADFDMSFIREAGRKYARPVPNDVVDTLYLARLLLTDLKRHRLNIVAEALGIRLEHHHRAIDDARATGGILVKLFERLEEQGIYRLKDVGKLESGQIDFKNKDTYHTIILVQNATGLKNLYKLISDSHMKYFYKKPRIPKSVLSAHREGLLIGSACQAGEVFQALLNRKPDIELIDIIKFYDYLEIQPLVNNEFLVSEEKVDGRDKLAELNQEIISLGTRCGKLTVATCDAHYMDPDEALYRKILMSGQNFKDIEGDKGLFFRTTEEMLEEFAYLGDETARLVVIDHPGRIADLIDAIQPIPDGTFPPNIEGSEETLRNICWDTARKIYGDPLPAIVENRLDRELKSIIGHGYAVMYVVAQMLVHKSMEDGYLVGSRGSVGSSFAATMSGITEVNPLSAHYICPQCRHSDFTNEEGCDCGVDMPDKYCPVCGTLYNKDGFSIPFEVFLGFEGDKEPDIDLNFAGEYQSNAHKYTETIFGADNVYRAGTIGTIASKTAYGFVMKYFEERGESISKWEAERLTQCCTGVKRTTGQHPGGVMIVPKDKEIYDFCPIQYPANDAGSGVVTTHFDYHSISGRLLKLDILGHDVPTMIRMLQDMTGLDPLTVPLRDEKVNGIFNGIGGIDIKIENYRYNHGTFGIPEFGTKFVRQMLDVTNPSTFSDLVRISGLSHGTNVWLNNASDLIAGGTAVLKDVVSCRDDIMNFLISKGVANKQAFKIMESVRKGKGVPEPDAEAMRACNVPEWYIESCRKIEYMFPKAHAVAYVMMSYRIAYYKVYYPLEFYAVVFSMKASEFDAETILKGIRAVERKIEMVEELGKNAAKKEENELTVLELAYEMMARGYGFAPAEIGVSDALNFKVVDGKVVVPLVALAGVGESAAVSVVEEFAKGPFMSIDDLKSRTRINKTAVAALQSHGALARLPESDQLSLF